MCTVVLSGSAVANLPTGSGEKPSRNPRAIFLTLTLSRSYSKNRVVYSFFLGIAKLTLSFLFFVKSTVLYFNVFFNQYFDGPFFQRVDENSSCVTKLTYLFPSFADSSINIKKCPLTLLFGLDAIFLKSH